MILSVHVHQQMALDSLKQAQLEMHHKDTTYTQYRAIFHAPEMTFLRQKI